MWVLLGLASSLSSTVREPGLRTYACGSPDQSSYVASGPFDGLAR